MALDRFYTGLSDVDLAKDAIAEKPDIYIQKFEYIGTGVYAVDTTGTSTLTPAVAPSWVADDYISTVALNLIVYDDNNKAASGMVADNDTTSITFDETAMTLDEDGSTAPTFTAGNTYNFYVLTPSSITGNTYGPFFGYTEGAELNINDTYMKFKYSTPKALKFKDLEERECQITGIHINFVNEDVMEAFTGGVNFGSQTGQYSKGIGHNPAESNFYRITFIGDDRNGRSTIVICRKCQFEMTGNIYQNAESGHYAAPFTADLTADGFYPVTSDLIQIIHSDS
jgi:hypothetical protein